MKPKAMIAYGLLGVLSAGVGGRLLYIELARWDMNDHNNKYDRAFADIALKAAWDNKIKNIEQGWDELMPKNEPCGLSSDIKADWEGDYKRFTGLTVDGEEECNKSRERAREYMEANKQVEKNELGTYGDWVLKQTGLEKYHRWYKYPADLRERITRGEQGLMLGKFWEYIL